MRRHARSLEDCLMADAGLARLSTHMQRLLQLQRRFESASPLAQQARVANLKFGKIVIHANNGAVATKLRQMEPSLTDVFRSMAAEVTGIDIRVQPKVENRSMSKAQVRAEIGHKQKQGLTSLADSLPESSALKTALARLAQRSRGR
jgi:hypothetical protein